LGLGDVVVLHCAVHNGAARFAEGQFGVLSSDYEGMPNAMQECMAQGVPMVATAVSGIPEMITDGVDGLLVPAQDPAALADALRRITSDAELRVKLGVAARERMVPFGWDLIVQRHLALYREVLDARAARRKRRAR
jgi:glycosyltransferase involved in cell wall biosynthesis